MKICYIYDSVYPWETGGVQTRVWELARRLGEDHDVHWFGLHYWDGPSVMERDGITFHGVMNPPELYVGGRRSITEALTFSLRLLRPLLSMEFDVIDCQEFPYFSAFPSKLHSIAQGSTFVYTWHEVWGNYWYDYLGRVKGSFGKGIERVAAVLPDEHIAVSELTRQDVNSLGREARLIPNGINYDQISRQPVSNDDVDVLFIGRLIREKGAHVLIRAIERLGQEGEDVTCTIVGDGPEFGNLADMVESAELTDVISLEGKIEDHDRVIGLLKAANVYVLPSNREGFGITVLEALASGTPVVTTNEARNAAKDLVTEGKTGEVTDRTPNAIANGIRQARDHSPADCRNAAKEYDWDGISQQVERMYRDVC